MKEKKFDCVRMKNEIQEKLLKEIEGLSLEERRERFEREVLSDTILGPLWLNSRKIRTSGLRPKT